MTAEHAGDQPARIEEAAGLAELTGENAIDFFLFREDGVEELVEAGVDELDVGQGLAKAVEQLGGLGLDGHVVAAVEDEDGVGAEAVALFLDEFLGVFDGAVELEDFVAFEGPADFGAVVEIAIVGAEAESEDLAAVG